MTTVYLDTFATKDDVQCYANEFYPPILDPTSPVHGYYGLGVDEGTVKEECLVDTDPERTAVVVSCYIGQGDDSTG